MVHQRNPNMAPDTEYELGEFLHLVEGNIGQLLDPRRTPVRITAILVKTGQFELEILDFEDKGARWIVDFENVGHYQFIQGSERQCNLDPLLAAIKRFDRQECIPTTNYPPLDLHSLGEQAASRINDLVFDLKAEVSCK